MVYTTYGKIGDGLVLPVPAMTLPIDQDVPTRCSISLRFSVHACLMNLKQPMALLTFH